MENCFGIYVIFRKKNQRKTVPEVVTRQQGMPRGVGRAGLPCESLERLLGPFFCPKKDIFAIKIPSKFHPDRSYGSPDI